MAKKKTKKARPSKPKRIAPRVKKPATKTTVAKKTAPKKTAVAKKPAPASSAPPPPPPAPPPGSFVWHELMTTDVDGSRKFYSELFKWPARQTEMGPGAMYTLYKHGGKDHAGMMAMAGPDWEGKPPHWMVYVGVKDVDAAAARAEQLGGKVCVPPTDIPVGRFAVVSDPSGASFGIYKSIN